MDEQKKKILIIDDEAKFGDMVKKNLEKAGPYEVTVETKGSQGLEAARRLRPDLIFMDVLMPDKRGPELAYEIHQEEKLKNTPIVFLTATVQKGQTEAFGGIVGGMPFKIKPAISKPASVKDLLKVIQENLPPES